MILLLLVSAAALWALSGLFLLPLPLAMALAWVWQRLCDRARRLSSGPGPAVLALCARLFHPFYVLIQEVIL